MNFKKQLREGLLTNNPVVGQLLGMCFDWFDRGMTDAAYDDLHRMLQLIQSGKRLDICILQNIIGYCLTSTKRIYKNV